MIKEEFLQMFLNLAILLILSAFTYISIKFFVKSGKKQKRHGIPKQRTRVLKIILILAYIVTIIGFTSKYLLEKLKDQEIRNYLVSNASIIADGLNPRTVPTFDFSEQDLYIPTYHRLMKQLKTLTKTYKGYEIFTIARKNGLYVYGPSVSDIDSTITILPGTRFVGATALLDSIYNGGEYATKGPYFNGNHSVLTGFGAILIPRSTEPLLIVGLSIPEKTWKKEKTNAGILPKSLTIILLLVLSFSFLVLSRKKNVEFSGTSWWRSPPAIFALSFGLIITFLFSLYIISSENKLRNRIFKQMSSVQASQIRSYIRSLDGRMNTVAQNIQAAANIDDATFKEIVLPLFSSEFILKAGLIGFPKNNNSESLSYSSIKFSEPNGDTLFKVGHPFPILTKETELLLSESIRTGLNGYDGTFLLPSLEDAICFYYPVKLSGQTNNSVLFIIAEPNNLLAESIAVLGPGKAYFRILQLSRKENKEKDKIAAFPQTMTVWENNEALESVYPQLIFGKSFSYYFREGALFRKLHPSIPPFSAPLTGLFLTLLLAFLIGSMGTRKAILEQEVQSRTMQLKKSEVRFSQLFSSMTEGAALNAIVRDLSGNIIDFRLIDVNPVFLKIWDFMREDIIGKTSMEVFNTGAPFNLDEISKVVNLKQSKQFEYYHPVSEKYFLISLSPWGDDGFAAIFSDFTKHKLAELALQKSEEKYRLLIENHIDLIIKVDMDGRYLYASPSFCRTFGKDETELINHIFIPQIHVDDIEISLNHLNELRKPPYKNQFQQRVKTVYGWRWFSWKNSSIINEYGEIKGYVGVGRDVTQQKDFENMLFESREKLQVQNQEYAILNEEYQSLNEELRCSNEDLMLAIEKARESDNLKTAFLQNISHEIRTPLNAVIGFSEMLSLSDLTGQDKVDFANIIINSSRQLLSIVNDVLTISTLETRQERINLSPVDPNDLLLEMQVVFQSKADSKGIELKYINQDTSIIILQTDEMKIKQVLNNLIGNAIKFTNNGFVHFGYEIFDLEVRFYIKDTGLGIPKDSLNLIFERFRQAVNNDAAVHGGTGLGLAISKGLIELLGGKIWVESEQGKGSTFYFEIPINN